MPMNPPKKVNAKLKPTCPRPEIPKPSAEMMDHYILNLLHSYINAVWVAFLDAVFYGLWLVCVFHVMAAVMVQNSAVKPMQRS